MKEVFEGLFDEPEPEAQPLDSWHLNWLFSDAPRTPSEARDRVGEIARQQGVSEEEAKILLAKQLSELSQEDS